MEDPGFWWELAGRVGGPLIAGPVVAALVQERVGLAHVALAALGLALLFAEHLRHSRGARR